MSKLGVELKRYRYHIVAALFFTLLARIVQLHRSRHELFLKLSAKYKKGSAKHARLSAIDVISLLRENGVAIEEQQFKQWVGNIDDEQDGYDEKELEQAVDLFDDFESATTTLQTLGGSSFFGLGFSAIGDMCLLVCAAAMLSYFLKNTSTLEKSIAANRFVSAVKMSKMKAEWGALEQRIQEYDRDRDELEKMTHSISTASEEAVRKAQDFEKKFNEEKARGEITADNLRKAEEERKKLVEEAEAAKQRLAEHTEQIESVQAKEEAAERELNNLRAKAERHMQEAHMSSEKLKAMTSSLRGLHSVGMAAPFKGAGEGKYSVKGAKTGFAVGKPGRSQSGRHQGFRMESFIFGFPTEDDVVLFEVNRKKDLLGEGADCAFKCRNIETGKNFALKIYDIKGNSHRRQILCDLAVHQATQNHPHIVKYHQVIESEEQIFVLMELIPGKDLFTDILDRNGLSESRAAKIFSQVLDALEFLHSQDIVHGDLKPENVMIEKPESDDPLAKVIDFGFSCFLNQENPEDDRGLVSTFNSPVTDLYSPPEALVGNNRTTVETDSFRLGCMLYVMLMATYPFDRSCRDVEARRAGRVAEYPKWRTLSENCRDLIVKLVKDRLPVVQAKEHPWVTSGGA